jgi:hypothetical protein
VLLAFWKLEAPVSLADAPALNALHHRGERRVEVLGICLPPAPSCADEHEHGGEHAHHHQDAASPSLGSVQGGALVRHAMLERKLRFQTLLDPQGSLGRRFEVEDLPTYVLIDDQGIVRRRLVGNRTEPVLEALINDVLAGEVAQGERSAEKGYTLRHVPESNRR